MKNLLFPAAVALCLFCSCGSGNKDQPSYTLPPAAAGQQNTASPNQAAPVSNPFTDQPAKAPIPVQKVTVQNNAPVVVQPVVQTATAPVAKGMNPAHGQPGHRCDIAVGAPLNSPPNAGQVQKLTVPSQPVATAPPVKTAPGMNPPHGQPNHRCDIAVGAPLNSKPAIAPTPVQQVTPTVVQDTAKKG